MRVGIVTKPNLVAARDTLLGLEAWLHTHRVDGVWAPDAAALMPVAERVIATREEMPAAVDLVLVLGGDGTLLAMADSHRAFRSRRANSRGQFRIARVPHRDHASRVVQERSRRRSRDESITTNA